MTADRWWVRAAARWLARFKTTEGQLRSLSLAITAFSTFSLMLQNAGYGYAVKYVGVIGVIAWAGYTYLYSEGGVHNQTQRDMVDLSDNYSGPTMLMDARIEGRQFTKLVKLLQSDREYSEAEIQEQILEVTEDEWSKLREGVNLEYLEAKNDV